MERRDRLWLLWMLILLAAFAGCVAAYVLSRLWTPIEVW